MKINVAIVEDEKHYNNALKKIIDYKHKICVVKDQGVRKGIYFCDLI